jgi:hypothetical protein
VEKAEKVVKAAPAKRGRRRKSSPHPVEEEDPVTALAHDTTMMSITKGKLKMII